MSVAYDVGVCSVSSDYVMYACHEGCMSIIFGMRSFRYFAIFCPGGKEHGGP